MARSRLNTTLPFGLRALKLASFRRAQLALGMVARDFPKEQRLSPLSGSARLGVGFPKAQMLALAPGAPKPIRCGASL